MPQLKPGIGEIYRHFKGNLYQVTGLATHSETGEAMVVYQALYGDFATYVRPYELFVGEVDFEKYPECTDRFRFTLVPRASLQKAGQDAGKMPLEQERFGRDRADADPKRQAESATPMLSRQSIQDLMLAFLDERDFEKKEKILSEIGTRPELSDGLIDNLAAALDVVIDDGPLDKRFNSLRTCVRTRARFESTRLRG